MKNYWKWLNAGSVINFCILNKMTNSPLGHMCMWSAYASACILLGPPACVWHVCVCMSMWRPEVEVKYLPWMFSSLCVAC